MVLVGENFSETNSPYLHFKDQREAKDWFQGAGISNARILIKGSRGMTMERIIEP